jgi:hypothetical protein
LFCCELLLAELLLVKEVFCFKSGGGFGALKSQDFKSDLILLPILLEFIPNSLEGLFLELLLILSVVRFEISDCV